MTKLFAFTPTEQVSLAPEYQKGISGKVKIPEKLQGRQRTRQTDRDLIVPLHRETTLEDSSVLPAESSKPHLKKRSGGCPKSRK